MKLKSYYNPNRDTNLSQEVQVRLATDAAPAAPFVPLGDVTHEVNDNASGMQKLPISHVIFQHVQEQLYLQKGIQDMQKIRITIGGAFVLPTGFLISTGQTSVKPGENIAISFKIQPANATKDGYFLVAENPALITVVTNGATTGDWVVKFNTEGETILTVGVVNNPVLQSIVPIQAWTTMPKP